MFYFLLLAHSLDATWLSAKFTFEHYDCEVLKHIVITSLGQKQILL